MTKVEDIAVTEQFISSNIAEVVIDVDRTKNFKSYAPEIVVCESDADDEDDDDDEENKYNVFAKELRRSWKNYKSKFRKNSNSKTKNAEKNLSKNHKNLRGLLPPTADPSESDVKTHPTVKRCSIEHCYFTLNESNDEMKSAGGKNLLANDTMMPNTLPFSNENSLKSEQLTIDGESSRASEKCKVARFETEIKSLEKLREPKRASRRNLKRINYNFSTDTDESEVDDRNDQDYFPRKNSTKFKNRVERGSDVDRSRIARDGVQDGLAKSQGKGNDPVLKKVKIYKNVSAYSQGKKKIVIVKRSGTNVSSADPKTKTVPKNFVSVHDLLSKIRKMQKFASTKMCDQKLTTTIENRERILLPKLKRIAGSNRTKSTQSINRSTNASCLPVASNLTKPATAAKNKNWRVQYMDNEVQTLGLDDLLLKASELNAENFTKALGRKMEVLNPGFNNGKESSEIVLTIPKFKRQTTGPKQSEENLDKDAFVKQGDAKALKINITGSSFSKGEKEVIDGIADAKKVEDVGPKKAGIKVKTVENINEEFKDSLELKRKEIEESVTGSSQKGATSDMDGKEMTLEKPMSPMKEFSLRRGENSKVSLDEPLDNRPSEEDDRRPFIMTIVQGKADKQRPAILRNSAFFKRKSTTSDEWHHAEKDKLEKERNSILTSLEDAERNDGQDGENSHAETLNDESESKNGSETLNENVLEESIKPKNSTKKKNVPFILNHNRKSKSSESSLVNPVKSNASVKLIMGNGSVHEKAGQNDKVFRVTSIEQKLGPKEDNKRFVKMVPYEPETKGTIDSEDQQVRNADEDSPEKTLSKDSKVNHLLSLSAFSAILKEILPDKWFLCLDKKYGLQIMKTHVDEVLNPSVLMSVVIAKSGKVAVNVRGKQLDKCHQLFSNLCDVGNSDNKISLNYILAILNKLRYHSVCCGCDPALNKYSQKEISAAGDGSNGQQGYRSPLCPLLVSLGKKRCYPCYRMNESLKKRHRRDKAQEKAKEVEEGENSAVKVSTNVGRNLQEPEAETNARKAAIPTVQQSGRGVKRNLEDFLEESFSTMKQQIEDELEKKKKFGEMEKALKAQEEVLSFMGLTRKDNLDGNPVRKSKRTRSSLHKSQTQQTTSVMNEIDQKELEFLEMYWTDINTLFSTSLLFGAYSRTGRSRLREKCRMFHKLLSTWRDIVKRNPDWIGGEVVSIPEEGDVAGDGMGADRFDKMDVTGLRAYIINSVKEVNRLKHKLRTRNSYFKLLYNKFVKRRIKRSKSGSGSGEKTEDEEKKEVQSSANSSMATPTDLSSDESSRDKEKPLESGERPAEKDANETVPDTTVPETGDSVVPATVDDAKVEPSDKPVPSPKSLEQD